MFYPQMRVYLNDKHVANVNGRHDMEDYQIAEVLQVGVNWLDDSLIDERKSCEAMDLVVKGEHWFTGKFVIHDDFIVPCGQLLIEFKE